MRLVSLLLASTILLNSGCLSKAHDGVRIPEPGEGSLYAYEGSDGSVLTIEFVTSLTQNGSWREAKFSYTLPQAEGATFDFVEVLDRQGNLALQRASCRGTISFDEGPLVCVDDQPVTSWAGRALPGALFSSHLWGMVLRNGDSFTTPTPKSAIGINAIASSVHEADGACVRLEDDFGSDRHAEARLFFFSHGSERIFCSGYPVPYSFRSAPQSIHGDFGPVQFVLAEVDSGGQPWAVNISVTPPPPPMPAARVSYGCPFYVNDSSDPTAFPTAEAHDAGLASSEEYRAFFPAPCAAWIVRSVYRLAGSVSGGAIGIPEIRHLRSMDVAGPYGQGLSIEIQKRVVTLGGTNQVSYEVVSVTPTDLYAAWSSSFTPIQNQAGLGGAIFAVRSVTGYAQDPVSMGFSHKAAGYYSWGARVEVFRTDGYEIGLLFPQPGTEPTGVSFPLRAIVDGPSGDVWLVEG